MRRHLILRSLTLVIIPALVWTCESSFGFPNPHASQRFWVPENLPRSHYRIECRVDTAAGQLTGTESIHIVNRTSRPFTRLALDWALNSGQSLSIAIGESMIGVHRDSAGANATAPLVFDLPRPVLPGKHEDVNLTFSLHLPMLRDQDKVTLVTWFPRLWWGIETHDDFDVKIDVPPTYAIATSGRFNNTSRYYEARAAASFGVFLGKHMRVAEKSSGDVLIRCLFTDKGEECARLVLKTAVDAVNFYRSWLGFYPFRSLSIVPGYDSPVGGYPAATSLAVIHGEERMSEKPAIHWRWITAHEIDHMYWGQFVLDKDSPGWLWIGMGIYGDREYIRARGLSLQMHRELMARYIQGVREHVNTTVAITPEQRSDVDFDFNNIVTHGKGFSIVSALAIYLGKDTFDRIYRRCLRRFGERRMGLAGFQTVCEAESGEDLTWFFDQWVRSNRYLSYQITSQDCVRRNGKYVSTIRVERTGTLSMPVPVVAYFQDGTSLQRSTERLEDINLLKFESSAPLQRVAVDPDSELAMIVPPVRMTLEELTKAVHHMPWTGAGKEAVKAFAEAQELKLADDFVWFKLGLALYDGEHYPEALEAFRHTAEIAADSSNFKFGAHVWQGHVLDLLGRRQDAIAQYRRALAIDAGQVLTHSQYGMVIDRKWVEARLQEPFVRR